MHYIFNSTPFFVFSLIILGFMGLGIYGLYDFYKKKPGNPLRFILWEFILAVLPTIWLSRYVQDFDVSDILLEISEIITIPLIALFILSFVVFFIIAYKKGFIKEEDYKKAKMTVIPAGIIILGLVAYIVYLRNT